MITEANTLHQTHSDPWLLAARNARLLGFAYPGSKVQLAKLIQPYMPLKGGIYCEPFAGLGALYWKMALTADYEEWRLNDLRTHSFFRSISTHGDVVEVPARSHEEFERQKAAFKLNDPAAILLGPYLTYNGGFYGKGERQDNGSIKAATYEARLRMCHAIMMVTQPIISAFDWKLVVKDLGRRDFVYFDPPYKDCNIGSYKTSDLDHKELVDELLGAPYKWLLSEYDNPIYARLGRPFWQKQVQLRSTNFRDDGGKQKRTECMWRNY
jgi:site-specific DNA-adenine methylase